MELQSLVFLSPATTFSIMTLSLKDLFATLSTMGLSITTLCIEWHFDEFHFAERRVSFIVIRSVIMLNVVAPAKWLS